MSEYEVLVPWSLTPDLAWLDVVSVAWNQLPLVKSHIAAFKAQYSQRFRLTVLHDGSPDPGFVDELVGERYLGGNVRLLATTQRFNDWGHSLRDIALRELVSLPWTLLTNADNYYTPEFVQQTEERAMKGGKLDVVMWNLAHNHHNHRYIKTEFALCKVDMGAFMTKTALARNIGFNHRNAEADGYFVEEIKMRLKHTGGVLLYHFDKLFMVHN